MKTGSLREVKEQLSNFIAKSQKEAVLITKHGKPTALVMGIEGHDMEDVFYMTNPQFWKMIKSRREQKSIPWRKAKRQLS
ncbi:MAG: type II toxin-antitoxin system Phd/YefM family antitoxin [Deltaproteobacteria bacterium]|nr:type II toxin-antitoxin system Phd/YefM family antitoxin [Deltaproteobacteria bacterium]